MVGAGLAAAGVSGTAAIVATTVVAGAVTGAVGDAAGQLTGMALGTQSSYNVQQTLGAALGGAVFGPLAGGLTRALGGSAAVSSSLGRSTAVLAASGFGSGFVGDVATQVLEGRSLTEVDYGRSLLVGGLAAVAAPAARGLQEKLPRGLRQVGSSEWFAARPRWSRVGQAARAFLADEAGSVPGGGFRDPKNPRQLTFGDLTETKAPVGGEVAPVQGAAANPVQRRVLYHYTDEAGMRGITQSGKLRPSLRANNPRDVRYGEGQYLSDFVPGTKPPAQLSREFLGQPFQGRRFTHYVEIDVTGLEVVQGRNGVFVVRGRRVEAMAEMLDLAQDEARGEFFRRLQRLGVAAALRRAGAQPGDRVRFGEVEIAWEA